MPVDHHVQHAVLEEVLRSLESLREFLSNGLLNNARTCKTDQCVRFGNLNVAEHRVRRRYASRGRVGEYRNVG